MREFKLMNAQDFLIVKNHYDAWFIKNKTGELIEKDFGTSMEAKEYLNDFLEEENMNIQDQERDYIRDTYEL